MSTLKVRPENFLGTSRINLPGMSLECQIRTFPGLYFRTSSGRQIGTSSGRQIGTSSEFSNRIFREHPGDVRGERPREVLGTDVCRHDNFVKKRSNI